MTTPFRLSHSPEYHIITVQSQAHMSHDTVYGCMRAVQSPSRVSIHKIFTWLALCQCTAKRSKGRPSKSAAICYNLNVPDQRGMFQHHDHVHNVSATSLPSALVRCRRTPPLRGAPRQPRPPILYASFPRPTILLKAHACAAFAEELRSTRGYLCNRDANHRLHALVRNLILL